MPRITWLVSILGLMGLLHLLSLSGCVHEPVIPAPRDTLPADPDTLPADTVPAPSVDCAPDTLYFTQDIFPLMTKHYCAACHTPEKNVGGVSMNSYANIIASDVIDLENPEASRLYLSMIETDPAKVMPPDPYDPMQPYETEMVRLWIAQGARDNSCNLAATCDTAGLTYTERIQPLLATHCTACHTAGNNPGGGVVLSSYAEVAEVARSGRLYGAVAHLEGYRAMPKDQARLADCEVYMIKAWVAQDYPE